MFFLPSMKACVSARLAEAGRFSTARTKPPGRCLAHDAPSASGDFRHGVRAEVMEDLVERALHRRQRGQMLDQAVAPRLGLARMHGLAVDEDGTREQVAVLVGVGLVELGRKAVREIVENVLPGCHVHGEIAPFAGRDLREAALHQRLGGRDQLHDGGAAFGEIGLDRADQRRALHGRDEVIEEPLLVGLEGGVRGGLGLAVERAPVARDVRGLQRGVEILMDDLEGAGIGVIDADLLGRELVLQHLDLDALVGERARGVEAERLEVAREHLHRGDAALLHGGDELRAAWRRARPLPWVTVLRRRRRLARRASGVGAGVGAPQVRGAGRRRGSRRWWRRSRRHRRRGRRAARAGGEGPRALLGGGAVAALGLVAGGVGHGVGLVEHDDAVERRGIAGCGHQPVDDLLEAGGLAFAFGRAQRGVGREEDAFAQA